MFAPGAGRFLAPALVLLAVLWGLFALAILPRTIPLALLLGLTSALVAFLAVFFRDPARAPGPGVVSAADGRVRDVRAEGDMWRISVFMNVTDVHVNRFPLTARVAAVSEGGHGFRPAYRPDAEGNVQRHYRLESAYGPVEVVQMTGVVAHRLVSFVGPGDTRAKGDRLGMIVLGSRVDVLVPESRLTPTVAVGRRVLAGVTTIAEERR